MEYGNLHVIFMNLITPFILNAFIGVVIISIMLTIIGTISTFRNVHYLSAEVAHAALGGASLGVIIYSIIEYEYVIFITAIMFSILTSILTCYIIREKGIEASGMAIGIALAISISIYAICISLMKTELIIKVNSYLLSDILLITIDDLIAILTTSIIGLIILIAFYKEIVYICFDLEGAESLGLNTKTYDYMIFILIGLCGAILARTIGALLAYALSIIPSACAREISDNIIKTFIYTFIIALIFGLSGLIISIIFNLTTSGTIAAIAVLTYITIKIIKYHIVR